MQTRFTHRLLTGAGIAACAVALLAVRPASAQTDAVSSFKSVNSFQLSGLSVGYTFTMSSAFTVTSLGYFDFGADGFVDTHLVGLYNSAGTQIATANVGSGSALGTLFSPDTVNGSVGTPSAFRYTALGAGLSLAAGSYTIAAYTGNTTGSTADQFFYNANTLVTAPQFTYGTGVAASSPGGLSTTAPGANPSGVSYFGPDFRFTAGGAAGPEPGTFVLFGTGLLSMGGVTLRRRSKKAAK